MSDSTPIVLPNFAKIVYVFRTSLTRTPLHEPAVCRQGPTLIGLFFNLILYGTFLSQAHYYFSTFKRCVVLVAILVIPTC